METEYTQTQQDEQKLVELNEKYEGNLDPSTGVFTPKPNNRKIKLLKTIVWDFCAKTFILNRKYWSFCRPKLFIS